MGLPIIGIPEKPVSFAVGSLPVEYRPALVSAVKT